MEKKVKIRQMFDGIAFRYDLLNHLLSFGIDFYWRKKALQLAKINKDSVLLDVACGTGDFAIQAKKMGVEKIVGADFSYNMLILFNKKSNWIQGRTMQMAAELLPLKNESVTDITVAFGVRNFYNIPDAFDNFFRILTLGGKVIILEFRMPTNFLMRFLYKFYFKYILPFVGGLISRDFKAYKYLPDSVEEFDEKVNLKELLKAAGFREVKTTPLTFGIVQVVIAYK